MIILRAIIQRVKNASVSVDGKITGKIGHGILIYLGVDTGDNESDLDYIFKKTVSLRIFSDDEGKMNKSLSDVSGSVLLISQFTLSGDARRGTRPSFSSAAKPHDAELLYEAFKSRLREMGIESGSGVFGADMEVSSVNDGPVTILLDSKKLF